MNTIRIERFIFFDKYKDKQVKEYEVYFFSDDSLYALFSLCPIVLWTQFGFKHM
jgi:hypothetical protein